MEVGGTTVRAAAFDPDTRQIGPVVRLPSPNYLTRPADVVHHDLLAAIDRLGGQLLGDQPPAAVSVAYPGPVAADGMALAAPTLLGPFSVPFSLRQACQSLWPDAQVTVMNDLTAAGYRYVETGRYNFCVVTVGSGVGHKIFLDGCPLVGPAGRGGEMGHLLVDTSPSALPCDCGARGHLGGVASGRGVLAALRAAAIASPSGFDRSALGQKGLAADSVDNLNLVAAFKSGDAFVGQVVTTAAGQLGTVLAAAHLLVGVEDFILVGGFALALGEGYRQLVAAAAAAASWDLGQVWDTMVTLGHEDDASGLLGAGLAAEQART